MGAPDWLLLWAAVISASKMGATRPPGFLEGGGRLPLSPLLAERANRTRPYPCMESSLGTGQSPSLLCWALRCIAKVWSGRGGGGKRREGRGRRGSVCLSSDTGGQATSGGAGRADSPAGSLCPSLCYLDGYICVQHESVLAPGSSTRPTNEQAGVPQTGRRRGGKGGRKAEGSVL